MQSWTNHFRVLLHAEPRERERRPLTRPSEALDRRGEAPGSGQQVVLEDGQPLGDGHLHADAVLLLREARALTVQEELGHGGDRGYPRRRAPTFPRTEHVLLIWSNDTTL